MANERKYGVFSDIDTDPEEVRRLNKLLGFDDQSLERKSSTEKGIWDHLKESGPEPKDQKALLEEACLILARIADAYDANELDDEARKFWGRDLENENQRNPSEIELFCGRGGKTLLTLADCLKAREALKVKDETTP